MFVWKNDGFLNLRHVHCDHDHYMKGMIFQITLTSGSYLHNIVFKGDPTDSFLYCFSKCFLTKRSTFRISPRFPIPITKPVVLFNKNKTKKNATPQSLNLQ